MDFCVFDIGLLFSPLLLVARRNPSSSMSRRWNGTTSPRRPGYAEMLAPSLLSPNSLEAEAHRDAEEVHGMFQDLSARVQQDKEVAARVRKE